MGNKQDWGRIIREYRTYTIREFYLKQKLKEEIEEFIQEHVDSTIDLSVFFNSNGKYIVIETWG